MTGPRTLRAFPIVAVLAMGLALGACAHNTAEDLSGAAYGAGAGPGSLQEFTGSIGDRVFFETDSTELTSAGQATLDKQATWLNQYPRYTFTIEGHADERGTR
jgi:peptidoglycan-associated lipoprotein